MGDVRRYHDTIVFTVPAQASPMVDGVLVVERMKVLAEILTDRARQEIWIRYPRTTVLGANWTVATTAESIEDWPLPHECDDCREGKTKALAALAENPDLIFALGDVTCEEPVR